MTKAVFFDIDGTLINISTGQTRMSAAVREAIYKLRNAGHHAFIASGRPWPYIDDELKNSDLFDGYVITNGSVVVLNGQVIYEQPLAKQTVSDVIKIAEQHNIEYILESYPDVYLRSDFTGLEKVYRDIDINVDSFIRDYPPAEELAICKIEFLGQTDESLAVFNELINLPGLTGLIDPTILRYMELYAADVSKATGIKKALEYLGLPLEASYAFGDGLNDIEMMSTVGHSLVMGNAAAELKKLAEVVLPSVDDDGVAFGIENYVLTDK